MEDALAKIHGEHGVETRVFLAKDLEDVAMELADDQIFDVIGTIIPEAGLLPAIDFGILSEVVKHVLGKTRPVSAGDLLRAPDFEEKLHFNGLTSGVANLLTVASYQQEAVIDFFAKNSEFARQQLRDHVAAMYLESVDRIRDLIQDEELQGDLVFFDLRDRMTPPIEASGPDILARAHDAVTVITAYYFEACDVFEDPSHATS